MTDLRDPVHKETGVRIFEGGWHFSYCGGLNGVPIQERVRMKINDFAHQELATSWNLRRLPKRLSNQKDPFGRKGTRFERVPIDNRFPDYLVQNQSKYSYMILA
jgi:hypothetical protein